MNSDLTLNLKKITLSTPIILLSGTVSIPILSFLHPEEIGAVVLKTITLNPKDPNPVPRMYDLGFGVLNSIGLFNPGAEIFFREEFPLYEKLDFVYMISLGEFSTETFFELIDFVKEKVAQNKKIAGIELNFSCPNVKQGGISFSRDPDSMKSIVSYLAKDFKKEIWVKISPISSLEAQLKAAEEGGATAVVVANTIPATSYVSEKGKVALGAGSGGLSGPALRPINLELVRQAKSISSLPIIASGGIGSFGDVLEYALAGASAFGVGTALFKDPRTPRFIFNEMKKFFEDKNITSFEEFINNPGRISFWIQESESL